MTDSPAPTPLVARAARTRLNQPKLSGKALADATVTKYLIGPHDMAVIYLSPDPYGRVFDKTLDLRKWDLTRHKAGG